ncbi:putative disease resistance protein RGA3 isoform X4 [Jatropha curcas]|uniref:putative disease resistance protein RGA3 isoform X4 n=1 Tax=Jatropha curcas TaxID=180498 RepID=UPI0009D66789|nr:putative disease resistance protein RGA3 isoform X4 [Jatropha curcas]
MGKTISVDESSVYGRNDDKEAIIENLLSADENGLEVISIIGMGGIGKTLFTKLVYSDIRVQNWFDITVWVCAAAKFDIFKIAKDILEEVSAKSCDFKSPIPNREILPALKGRLMGLEIIGREIVKKCQGLPLIAKMLGDLLCSERNVEVWQRISNNMEVRSHYNICMILKLSHVDLLFHLRQCLAFGIKCPKDYTLVKEKLVLSWIQENLVRFNKTVEKEEVDNNFFFTNLESRDNIIHDIAISSVSENFLQCSISQIYIEAILEWAITGIYLVLEILLVTLEQIGSPKRPRCAFYALVVSFVALFICIVEIVCKGQKQNIDLRRQGIGYWLRFPSSNHNPYTYIDIFSLVSAISQVIFSCIAYSYLRRGAQNPIKMCFVPVIFTFCMASSRLVRKPNETKLPITSD